ncbi:MAG: 50S ribosomal protein L1 [Planctomycetes bacterium RBG_16_59_8]|nr:MAG: 50S ribosomal protein L1 [Planctomycetes bacterium RBG_16_59_8]
MRSKGRSKRYLKDVKDVQADVRRSIDDAIATLRKFSAVKFDQTVELAIRLGIDAEKTEQAVRGSVSLPKGLGKTRKVIVFADGEEADDAKKMGADEIGGADLVQKIEGGWTDFDVVIAHPRMMKFVGKLGKILGPQGKMPSPKSGTVSEDIKNTVKEFKAGKVEFRSDKGGNVHAPVGKLSFKDEDLKENIIAFMEHIRQVKPPAVKGTFLVSAAISATMSPGVALALNEAPV